MDARKAAAAAAIVVAVAAAGWYAFGPAEEGAAVRARLRAFTDAVNAQGDVVVKAGKRSSVWIFNCVPTNQPPNTGAGTTAGLVLPGLAPGGSGNAGIVPQSAIAMEMHRRLLDLFG